MNNYIATSLLILFSVFTTKGNALVCTSEKIDDRGHLKVVYTEAGDESLIEVSFVDDFDLLIGFKGTFRTGVLKSSGGFSKTTGIRNSGLGGSLASLAEIDTFELSIRDSDNRGSAVLNRQDFQSMTIKNLTCE